MTTVTCTKCHNPFEAPGKQSVCPACHKESDRAANRRSKLRLKLRPDEPSAASRQSHLFRIAELSHREVATKLGISPQRVQQLERSAIRKIQIALRPEVEQIEPDMNIVQFEPVVKVTREQIDQYNEAANPDLCAA